ncbi:antibiotic biosynthesis monooxygenase [Sphingomonas sp. AP4-R1]|uniref:putative quinol monooxygenase n=1 Tax=Sphingomonas sp. AP4-R1 TaxID=2735134 RepID=UPI0014935709|nr:putative quinol monooxygenase [Sphingomonas sp. AP4-R1]QJU58157.1 antibiotic biosynthesis monooxygenase [Sphingomonas sp. AP4-R1]
MSQNITLADNGEVACVAITVAKPGFEARVRKALEDLIDPVRAEQGCLQYDLHVDLDNDGRFAFVERWTNLEDFNAHCVAPHINDYLELTNGWLADAQHFPMRRIG